MPDHSSHPSHPSHPGLPSLASNFDTPRLSSAASIISRPGVEPAVGASRECAPPTGHSNRSRICAVAAAAAENHGRGTLSPPLALASSTTLACPGQTPAPHAILPVLDIPACLDSRAPAPHFDAEPRLFGTLPAALKAELRCLLGRAPGQGAFSAVQAAVNRGLSVTQSCAKTWRHFAHALTCGPKQFRPLRPLPKNPRLGLPGQPRPRRRRLEIPRQRPRRTYPRIYRAARRRLQTR